jgi:hypothetical protein
VPTGRVIRNQDVEEVRVEVPEGHEHLRITVRLVDGMEIVLQEATVAGIVRAYVSIKTHPTLLGVRLRGKPLGDRKAGYAEWQLLEED